MSTICYDNYRYRRKNGNYLDFQNNTKTDTQKINIGKIFTEN